MANLNFRGILVAMVLRYRTQYPDEQPEVDPLLTRIRSLAWNENVFLQNLVSSLLPIR